MERRWQGDAAMKQKEGVRASTPRRTGQPRPAYRPLSKLRVSPGRGVVVWVTGLPSSGKSTLGRTVVEALRVDGRAACLLDGDDVRGAIEPRPSYDDVGRNAFYATLAALAAMLAHQGLAVVVAATAHRRAYRERARELSPAFVEVFVDVPLDECRRRDDKGLYDEATTGAIHALPGPQAAYEAPERPDVIARQGGVLATIAEIVEVVRRRSACPPSTRALGRSTTRRSA
jgi:adenylylsulfate kinase